MAFGVAGEQERCMVIAEWNHVCSAIDEGLLEPLMKFRQFRPMDAGEVMMFKVKTDIEHSEIEKV